MKKAFLQFLVTLLLFLGIWGGLSQINWIEILKIDISTTETEEKLGDLLWQYIEKSSRVIEDERAMQALDTIKTILCDSMYLDPDLFHMHLIDDPMVNAFALPGGHIIIFTGLIKEAENPAELAGVIAHEIAHVHLRHVMKKLIKEVGLSIIFTAAGGQGGGEVLQEILNHIASTAYDRGLEEEADMAAVDFLIHAGIDPHHYANILFKLAMLSEKEFQVPTWLSTHPDTEKRAKDIVETLGTNRYPDRQVLHPKTWRYLKALSR